MEADFVMQPPVYFAEDHTHIWDINFHPSKDLIASALISGKVQILAYNQNEVTPVGQFTDLHKDSVRTLHYNSNGILATGSADKRLGFIDQQHNTFKIKKAHDFGISKVHFLNNDILATGDDEGFVKVWDLRIQKCVHMVQEQEEAISGIAFEPNSSFMLTTSLDGSLGVFDLKKSGSLESKQRSSDSLYALSDCMEADLLGVQIIKDGKFVAVNSSEGAILLFKWDWFGNCKDRMLGHPNVIDAMIKVNQHTLISGCEDGFVRGLSIHPNKVVKIIGEHEEGERQKFPVQKLSLSHCRKILASCSHDNSIKFYDVANFVHQRQNPDFEQFVEQSGDMEVEDREGMENQDSDDLDDDDSDEEEEAPKKKKKKRTKTNIRKREHEISRDKRKDFFKDM